LVNRTPDPDPYLSVPDVAEQLGFSDQTILDWIRQKKLPAVQIGRRYRIRQSDVNRVVEANRTTAPALGEDSFWDDPEAQDFQLPGRHRGNG
jgi:excisionase family DNA binding protein